MGHSYAHTLTGDTLSSLSNITPEVIAQRIDTTLAELGLTDVAHQRIGNAIQRGISGGQKRRVTLGAALVTMPKILLLDEPTSGLDSSACFQTVSVMQRLTRDKHCPTGVVATIHQRISPYSLSTIPAFEEDLGYSLVTATSLG